MAGSAQGVTQTKERDRTGPLSHTLTPVDRSFLSCCSLKAFQWSVLVPNEMGSLICRNGGQILTLWIFTQTEKFSVLSVTNIYSAEFAVFL